MNYFTLLKQKPGFRYFSISFGILLIFTLVGMGCLVSMYNITNRVYEPIETANTEKEKFFLSDTIHNNIGKYKMAFLKMQYKTIGYSKEHHKEIGRIYYANHYTFTVILAIASILGAIILALIANKGWQSADTLVKVSFFSLFAISTFFGIMITTLGQKDNSENNFKQYLFYDKVQNNILTFVNTSEKYDSVQSKNVVDSFIVAINNDLRNNNQFFISIDANKVSLEDISSKLGKTMNGGSDSK
jgi:ABC-type sugar transport system permease subunit